MYSLSTKLCAAAKSPRKYPLKCLETSDSARGTQVAKCVPKPPDRTSCITLQSGTNCLGDRSSGTILTVTRYSAAFESVRGAVGATPYSSGCHRGFTRTPTGENRKTQSSQLSACRALSALPAGLQRPALIVLFWRCLKHLPRLVASSSTMAYRLILRTYSVLNLGSKCFVPSFGGKNCVCLLRSGQEGGQQLQPNQNHRACTCRTQHCVTRARSSLLPRYIYPRVVFLRNGCEGNSYRRQSIVNKENLIELSNS